MFSFGVVNLDTVFDMKILQKIYWAQSAFFHIENRQISASVFLSLSSLLRLRRTSVKLPVFLLLPLIEKDKHSKCLSTSSLSSWRPEHEWSQCAHQGSSPLLCCHMMMPTGDEQGKCIWFSSTPQTPTFPLRRFLGWFLCNHQQVFVPWASPMSSPVHTKPHAIYMCLSTNLGWIPMIITEPTCLSWWAGLQPHFMKAQANLKCSTLRSACLVVW